MPFAAHSAAVNYTEIPVVENWTAYVDLRAEAGDNNHANVLAIVPTGPDTQPIDPTVDWVLKDFNTGADLPVTMTVDMDVRYPTTNGTDSDAGTDADQIFGGIVDGEGGYELDLDGSGDHVTLTFENLDPAKEYVVAVTYNRNGLADGKNYSDRATAFTITGADSYVNASSAGVVVNAEDSVSFSTGENTANGYVAKWTGVTAADGSFSITAVQDASRPEWQGDKAYAMTSIVLKEVEPTPPEKFAFVVVSDSRTQSHLAGLEADLLQVQDWIISPTTAMPAPEFLVFNGDFDHSYQTDEIISTTLGTGFVWYPIIGNHEMDDINDFYYLRDTMFPALPWIVDSGPPGSVGTTTPGTMATRTLCPSTATGMGPRTPAPTMRCI